MARGNLRVFLGAAAGVGKTYTMLEAAQLKLQAGCDVVVVVVEDHGRQATRSMVGQLEVIPFREVEYHGLRSVEIDLEAVVERKPEIALVDEYAHSNIVGSHNKKRWQDVEYLLAHGIDVYTTLNVQHLESLNNVIYTITNVRQKETVPDTVVRYAQQIELVDLTPEMLRERLAAGLIYAPEKADAALANYFRIGNLTALREIALLWLADRVEEGLDKYRKNHGISEIWADRERVVVAISGGEEGEVLLRRAARILNRVSGGQLLAVHVHNYDGLLHGVSDQLVKQKALAEQLGGTYHLVVGDDPAKAVLEFANSVSATQIIVGTSRRKFFSTFFNGSGVGLKVAKDAGRIDVHMVSHPFVGKGFSKYSYGIFTRKWNFFATLFAVVFWLFFLANYFIPAQDKKYFSFFFITALTIFTIFFWSSFRKLKVARETQVTTSMLNSLLQNFLAGEDTLQATLARGKEIFQVSSLALVAREAGGTWKIIETVGDNPVVIPDLGDTVNYLDDNSCLIFAGKVLAAKYSWLISAFAAHVASVREHQELAASRKANLRLAASNQTRSYLLDTVAEELAKVVLNFEKINEKPTPLTFKKSMFALNLLVTNITDLANLSKNVIETNFRVVLWSEIINEALKNSGLHLPNLHISFAKDAKTVKTDFKLLAKVITNLLLIVAEHLQINELVIVSTKNLDTAQLQLIIIGENKNNTNKEKVQKFFENFFSPETNAPITASVAKEYLEILGGTLQIQFINNGGINVTLNFLSGF